MLSSYSVVQLFLFCAKTNSQKNMKVLINLFKIISLFSLIAGLDCRQATKPQEIEDIIKNIDHININIDNIQGPPCVLDVQKDFPKRSHNQPLYIKPNTNEFWLPNEMGQLQVPHAAKIELYCTHMFANSSKLESTKLPQTNRTERKRRQEMPTVNFANLLQFPKFTKRLKVQCLQDKHFMWQGEKYEFQQFVCDQPSSYVVQQLNEKCPKNTVSTTSINMGEMYRVGFNISRDGRFLETMRICFDNSEIRPLYVKHSIVAANIHFQKFVKRLNFSKAGYFKELNMNHLFSQYNQHRQAASLLGEGNHQHLFDNNTLFLARGHLAAKSDFIYANQQRATFNFFNVAPQWQAFNGGQWAALEDEVRKFAAKMHLKIDCYTGTWSTMILHSTAGNRTQNYNFYLATDANNNGIIPVPLLYYRVLIDRNQPQRGIVLVGVNNPHASAAEINSDYIVCEDIREQIPWLRWMRNKNIKKGFMYACRVPDFVTAVGHLPKELLQVTEILQ